MVVQTIRHAYPLLDCRTLAHTPTSLIITCHLCNYGAVAHYSRPLACLEENACISGWFNLFRIFLLFFFEGNSVGNNRVDKRLDLHAPNP